MRWTRRAHGRMDRARGGPHGESRGGPRGDGGIMPDVPPTAHLQFGIELCVRDGAAVVSVDSSKEFAELVDGSICVIIREGDVAIFI